MFKRLVPFLGKDKKYAILCPLMVVLEVILEVSIPIVMSKIIDIGVSNKNIVYISEMGLLMISMALLSLVFGGLAAKFSAIAGTSMAKNVRRELFYKVQDFSFSNVDKFSTASLVTRLTTDVNNIQNTFMMSIRLMVRSPIMFVGAIIMAIKVNSTLAQIFIVAVPVLVVALALIIKFAFPLYQEMLKRYDKLNQVVQENLRAIRVVKAFVREDYEKEKFQGVADDVRETQLKAEKIISLNMPLMTFVMYLCMIGVSWVGGNLIISSNMLTGEFMSFVSYIVQILISLMMISMIFVMFVLSKASTKRVIEVLDEEVEIKNEPKLLDGDNIVSSGEIQFKNVSFSYFGKNDKCVLENIDLKINSGETVGIIGGTGSSKTSLVQLIPRLYEATDGDVLVGGKNVKDYDITTLRNSVAMVLQKNVLFSGTIMENLKWGNENATEEEIIRACKSADAHNFISSFTEGYNTILDQGGTNVSGGQKQRICIARALLKKPKIIILDDSTSAVDTATDSRIRGELKENLKGTTTIIIAQRVSSISDAEKIIVMDEGKIINIGTHKELLQTSSIYKEVYESQQKGDE